MNNYGLGRAVFRIFKEFGHNILKVLSCAYSQRNVQIGAGARMSASVQVIAVGDIILGERAKINKGCVLVAEEGAKIYLGNDVIVDSNCKLIARKGGELKIGARTFISCGTVLDAAPLLRVGEKCWIGINCEIAAREKGAQGSLVVGDRCYIHNFNIIDLSGSVEIGDDVKTGPFAAIYTHLHNYKNPGLIWDQGITLSNVSIGAGTWIGHAAVILPGVAVGADSIVGSLACVTRSFENGSIIVGIPGKKIRTRQV